jgi:hypothetical protein
VHSLEYFSLENCYGHIAGFSHLASLSHILLIHFSPQLEEKTTKTIFTFVTGTGDTSKYYWNLLVD